MLRKVVGLVVALCLACATLFASAAGGATSAPRFDISRYVLDSDVPLNLADFQRIVKPYTGSQKSYADIWDAAGAVRAAIQDEGYPNALVVLPRQDLRKGQIRLKVIGAKTLARPSAPASPPRDEVLRVAAVGPVAPLVQAAMQAPAEKTVAAPVSPGSAAAPAAQLAQSAQETPPAAAPAVTSPRFDISRYIVKGNTLLPQTTIDKLVAPYMGKSKDFSDVQRALEAVQQAYQKAGFSAVQVLLPEQELEHGSVTFEVVEARVGQVSVEGNKFFKEANVRASVPSLKEGGTPNTLSIAKQLRVANENPSKQTNVLLRASENEGQVDAVVKVTDERPWKSSVTFDNTGNPQTGNDRIGVGYQNSNLFNRDHVFSVQYLTAPQQTKMDDVHILGAGYRIPLYRAGDTIDLTAGYSDVNSGTVHTAVTDFNVTGSGLVMGARYNYFLPKVGDYDQKLIVGYDHREFNNNVATVDVNGVIGTQLIPSVTTNPVSVTYSGDWRRPKSDFSFYLTGVENICVGSHGRGNHFNGSAGGGVPGNNFAPGTNPLPNPARIGADCNFGLLRYGLNFLYSLPKEWQFRFATNGQETSEPLVSGEQFGIGGLDSVRGFLEREVANDRGYRRSVEVYTPDIGGKLAGLGLKGARLRLMAFYDQGRVWRNDAQPGEQLTEGIESGGVGIRFGLKGFALRADVAQVTQQGSTKVRGSGRLHFSMGYIY